MPLDEPLAGLGNEVRLDAFKSDEIGRHELSLSAGFLLGREGYEEGFEGLFCRLV